MRGILDFDTAEKIGTRVVHEFMMAEYPPTPHKTKKAGEIAKARLAGACEIAALAFCSGTPDSILLPIIEKVHSLGEVPEWNFTSPARNQARKDYWMLVLNHLINEVWK